MPPDQPIHIAFLGCGFATRLHSRTLRRFGAGVHRSYASETAGRADEYRKRYSGLRAFSSYEAAIADPEVDVIFVATPPGSHLDLTLRAMTAGKHVIVEKPPFLHSADFDRIADAQRATGKRAFVAENYFYKPMTEAVRELIASGELGEVRLITINALKKQNSEGWRDRQEFAGGGAFFEGGIHWVDFMANIGLEVKSVRGFRPGPAEGADRTMMAVFEYVGGVVGTLYYSWEIGSPMRGLRLSAIYGTAGTATFESNGLFLGVRGKRRRIRLPHLTDLLGYGAMFEDFFRAIRTGHEARYDLELARRDLELVEKIYASLDGEITLNQVTGT